jgi:hypothetical protein
VSTSRLGIEQREGDLLEVRRQPAVSVTPLHRLKSALFENISRNEAGRCEYQDGNDDRVVEVTDYGYEIRDQIDWAQGVCKGGAEKPAGEARSPGMLQSNSIDLDLEPEALER